MENYYEEKAGDVTNFPKLSLLRDRARTKNIGLPVPSPPLPAPLDTDCCLQGLQIFWAPTARPLFASSEVAFCGERQYRLTLEPVIRV